MRLDKYLVACAIGSRTEVKNFLKSGRVTVNGKKEKSTRGEKISKTFSFLLGLIILIGLLFTLIGLLR